MEIGATVSTHFSGEVLEVKRRWTLVADLDEFFFRHSTYFRCMATCSWSCRTAGVSTGLRLAGRDIGTSQFQGWRLCEPALMQPLLDACPDQTRRDQRPSTSRPSDRQPAMGSVLGSYHKRIRGPERTPLPIPGRERFQRVVEVASPPEPTVAEREGPGATLTSCHSAVPSGATTPAPTTLKGGPHEACTKIGWIGRILWGGRLRSVHETSLLLVLNGACVGLHQGQCEMTDWCRGALW